MTCRQLYLFSVGKWPLRHQPAPSFLYNIKSTQTFDPDSNGPHGPFNPIISSIGSHLFRPKSTSLFHQPFNVVGKRRYAGTYKQTDSRDEVFETPSFEHVQREYHQDQDTNKAFSYSIVGLSGVVGAVAAKSTVMNLLASWSASSEALAFAQVEVELGDIPQGKSIVIKWRGKPIFIRHRTEQEIQEAQSVPLSELRDPEPDSARTQRPEWIVMLGICTHLGCVPLSDSGDYNGWFCPCHGSHYDISGRIRKGPAPTNMEIPTYEFLSDSLLRIG